MIVRIVLLLGDDDRTAKSYRNLVNKLPYKFQEAGTIFLAGILQFDPTEEKIAYRQLSHITAGEGESGIREKILTISSPDASLENILRTQIDSLKIHLIAHGREDLIGALSLHLTPYEFIKVSAEALAKFFLHNRPRETLEINLIDFLACSSLKLALCLSLLIPNSRIQGYENPIVVNEDGNVALYDLESKREASTAIVGGCGVIPVVRFISSALGTSPRMAGIPPVDFVLETAIRALESQEEFQTTLRNVRSIIAADRHPLDSEESAGGHSMFSSTQ